MYDKGTKVHININGDISTGTVIDIADMYTDGEWIMFDSPERGFEFFSHDWIEEVKV